MKFLVAVAVMLFVTAAAAAPPLGGASIRGFVADSANGERMISATVSIEGTRIGAYTNKNGFYVLQGLDAGTVIVRASYVGYRSREVSVTLADGESRTLNIELAAEAVHGQTVVVEGRRDEEHAEIAVSSITVTPKIIRQLPAVGESDLFRALQFLPGVQALSDFSSGLYIRGGSPDQNLVLLDGTIVYNPSHLFGFFSAFDPDAIKNVELIKGGFPAEYGGRLSAVLSVENKDGNRKEYEGTASLGLISSHASFQGPLPFGSFFVSGRRTYVDFVSTLLNASKNFNNGNPLPSYYFYDLNAKVNVDLPGDDRLMVSGYLGSDVLTFGNNDAFNFNFLWGNRLASAHYTHVFGEKAFGTFLVSASRFVNTLSGQGEGTGYTFNNAITDYTARGDMQWYAGRSHLIKFGAAATSYDFLLKNTIGSDSALTNIRLRPSLFSGYVQDDWSLTEELTLQTGVRTDAMASAPTQTVDPRIAMRYIASPTVTVKLAWGIYHQYLHLATPQSQQFFDIWLPTDKSLEASASTQYVAGVETHPWDGYNLNVDLYYKPMTNLTEFKSATAVGSRVADAFDVGSGKAYGAEIFLERRIGKVTGWIGYTLAWVRATFADINNGQPFAPKYDRRNDVDLVASWQVTDRWRIGAAWVYGSGQAYTDIIGRFEVDPPGFHDFTIRYPGPRGGLRLPPYHRLDVSATHAFHLFGEPAEFSMQIFNAYNRANVFTINYDTRQNPAVRTPVYLLPIIPTMNLEVSF